MLKSLFSAEKYPYKIEAIFNSEEEARAAKDELAVYSLLRPEEIMIITNRDQNWTRKIEPETSAIKYTMFRTHLIFGVAGLICGWALGILSVLSGVVFAVASPIFAVLVLSFIGLMLGLVFGGLLTLRPDHDHLINKADSALKQGKVVLLVHAMDHVELKRAKETLITMSPEVSTSL